MPNERINILEITADDLGCWAVGCAGNPEIRTPALDRLAAEGIYFVNFFCVSPVCSPALASLLTGRIPSYHGIHDYINDGNLAPEDGGGELGQTRVLRYLDGITGYPDILAENGYVCGRCGRWNLGDSRRPQMSSSFWYVHAMGGGPYYRAPMVLDGNIYRETSYVTHAITVEATKFLEEYCWDPFYLNVHYTAPHGPWEHDQHPKKFVNRYGDCPFDTCPNGFAHPWQVNAVARGTGSRRRELLAGYYAAVTAMDDSIGRLLDYLDELDLRRKTLIFFTSDNGMNMGHHGIWGKGNGTSPLNVYDTSLKVPTIISLPGTIPAGRIDRTLLSHYDWRPTLLEFLGIDDPEKYELPGEDFVELLRGGGVRNRNEIIVLAEYGPVRMVRDGDWKYVQRYPDGPDELYYLSVDPDEMFNLVEKESQSRRVTEMKKEMEIFFKEFSAVEHEGIDLPITGGGQYGLVSEERHGVTVFGEPFSWIDEDGSLREEGYEPPDEAV